MKLRFIFTAFFLLLTITTFAQQNNEYSNKKIGWKISFPESFKDMNLNKKPVQVVVAKNETSKSRKSTVTKYTDEIKYQGSKFTLFIASIEDEQEKIDLQKKAEAQNNSLVNALKESMSQAKFDTKYSTEKIDNVDFYKSELTMDLGNNVSQHFITYFTTRKDYYVNFSIAYANENEETTEIITAFKNSKFTK